MTLAQLIETCKAQLTFARIVKVNSSEDAPWAIGQILDIQTLEPHRSKKSIFLNADTLRYKFQHLQIGPFATPVGIVPEKYGLPKVGDIITGKTGTNDQGAVFVTWLPDLWARPISYFFYYLLNHSQASMLYESREYKLQIVLLDRLSVQFGLHLRDERLYDMLLILLFNNLDGLLHMCLKPAHKPTPSRVWDLTNVKMCQKIDRWCCTLADNEDNMFLYIPTVPEFIEELACLVCDSGLCVHFKTMLKMLYQEAKSTFKPQVKKWLQDETCMSTDVLDDLIAHKK